MILSISHHTGVRDKKSGTKLPLIALILYLITYFMLVSSAAIAQNSNERVLKSAFLYNFIKFTEWPDQPYNESLQPVNICLMGKNSLRQMFKSLEEKSVIHRPIQLMKVTDEKSLSPCSVLYIDNSVGERELRKTIQHIKNKPILSISEVDGFIFRGGMIGLTEEEGRMAFEISSKNARQAQISISSKLLELATYID